MKIFNIYINFFIFLVFTSLTFDYKKILKKTNNNDNLENSLLSLSFVKEFHFPNINNFIFELKLALKIIYDLIYLYLFVKFLNRKLIGLFFMAISIYKFYNLLINNKENFIFFDFSKTQITLSDFIKNLIIYFMLNLLCLFQLLFYCKKNKNKEIKLTFEDIEEN